MKHCIKRMGAFATGLALCASLTGGALAYTTADFADVPAGNWAYEPVMKMADAGIIKGSSATAFSPEVKVSAAMWLTLLGRAVYDGDVKAATTAEDNWYSAYVRVAEAKGLLAGTTIDKNAIQGEISRYDMAVTIYEATKLLLVKPAAVDISTIKDYGFIPNMYTTAVCQVYALGLIKGDGAGKFNGAATMTRAEAATVMDRLITLRDAKGRATPTFNDGKVSFTVKGRALVDGVPTAGVTVNFFYSGTILATAVSDQDGWCTFEAVQDSNQYSPEAKDYYARGTYTDASGTKHRTRWENIIKKSLDEQQDDFDCAIVTQVEIPPRTGEEKSFEFYGDAFRMEWLTFIPAAGANVKLLFKDGRVLAETTADQNGKFSTTVTVDAADYSYTADWYLIEVRWTDENGVKWSNMRTGGTPNTHNLATEDLGGWHARLFNDDDYDLDF